MKKAISLLLALLTLSFCACGQTPTPAETSSSPASQSQPEETPTALAEPSSEGSSPAESPAQSKNEYPTTMTYLCPEGFDYAEEFENGYAFAIRGLDCGYVDKAGNFTVSYRIDQEIWDEWFVNGGLVTYELSSGHAAARFPMSEEGLYPFLEIDGSTDNQPYKGYWGYKNIHTGEVVIEPQYCTPTPFVDGRAVVALKAEIIPPEPTSSGPSPDGWVANASQGINATHRYHVIDTSGKVVFEAKGVQQGRYYNGLLHVGIKENSHGMVDRDGNVVLDLGEYDGLGGAPDLYYFSATVFGGGCRNDAAYDPEHILSWTLSGEIFYVNTKGERTAAPPAEAANAAAFRGGICGYQNADGKWGLWDVNGKVLTPPIFTNFGIFGYNGDPTVLAEEDYSWGTEDGTPDMFGQMQYTSCYVINNKGQRVGDASYERLGVYSEGLMAAKKDGKWGYITPEDGSVVIDYIYDYVGAFTGGVSSVQKDGEGYFINKKGERLEGAETQVNYTCEKGTYLTFQDGKFNFAVAS